MSGESKWQTLDGNRRIVRKSPQTDGQKWSEPDCSKSTTTSEKSAKMVENQCHAEGGATKGGVSKCEQTQANADKRGQTQANAEAQTQANAGKREQTWTNANKRLHPPLLRFFTPPFAIPLENKQKKQVNKHRSIQIDYRQRLFLGGIHFQLQIQN